jgi:flagellar hook assembly protein FlgD
LVRALPTGELESGASVTWDGRDTLGRAVPAGVYFVRVEARGGTAVERLVRLR